MFDRAKIMKAAWEIVKKGPNWQEYRLLRLKYALQDAWAAAKRAIKNATQTVAGRIREAIFVLECKDRWTRADYAAAADLAAELRAIDADNPALATAA